MAAGSIAQEEQQRQAQAQHGSSGLAEEGDDDGDAWPEGVEGAGISSAAADEEELAAAVRLLAEMAVLGLGDADRLFPASLDEHYSSMSDELAFRVAL
jgi:hypothetical protein